MGTDRAAMARGTENSSANEEKEESLKNEEQGVSAEAIGHGDEEAPQSGVGSGSRAGGDRHAEALASYCRGRMQLECSRSELSDTHTFHT